MAQTTNERMDGAALVAMLGSITEQVGVFAGHYRRWLDEVAAGARADLSDEAWSEADLLDVARTLNVGKVDDLMNGLRRLQDAVDTL